MGFYHKAFLSDLCVSDIWSFYQFWHLIIFSQFKYQPISGYQFWYLLQILILVSILLDDLCSYWYLCLTTQIQPNHLPSNLRISDPILGRCNISLIRACQFHQPTCFSSQAGPCLVRTCSIAIASTYINGFFWRLCEDVGLKHLNSSNRISCSDDALVSIFSQTKVPGNGNTCGSFLSRVDARYGKWA